MINQLIENAFKRASDNGDLDDLRGAGKPIDPSSLTADPFAHVYGESGTMTPVGAMREKIADARHRLAEATDADRKRAIEREISLLETQAAVEMETFKRHG